MLKSLNISQQILRRTIFLKNLEYNVKYKLNFNELNNIIW